MIRKLTLAAGFGAGYVLGAKAGTQRYTQIEAKVRELLGQPAVQEFGSKASSAAGAAADQTKNTVSEKASVGSDRVSSPAADSPSIGASGTTVSSAPASIEEMSDLELDLATTPTPPPSTAATQSGPSISGAKAAPSTQAGKPGDTAKVEVERGL